MVYKWDDILKSYSSTINGFKTYLLNAGITEVEEAIRDLYSALELWQSCLPLLPQQRTEDTIAKQEVQDFVEKPAGEES